MGVMVIVVPLISVLLATVVGIAGYARDRRRQRAREGLDREGLEAAGGPWDPERRAVLKAAWLELEQQFGPEMTPTPSWVRGQPKRKRLARPNPRSGAGVERRPSTPNPTVRETRLSVDNDEFIRRAERRAKMQRHLDVMRGKVEEWAPKAREDAHYVEMIGQLNKEIVRLEKRLVAEISAAFPTHVEPQHDPALDRVAKNVAALREAQRKGAAEFERRAGSGVISLPGARRLEREGAEQLKRLWEAGWLTTNEARRALPMVLEEGCEVRRLGG